uniref:Uncharacterized protein n=1 Tax=Cacopsylla melanoneura TaxID=428564 RepID=A0A8D8PYE6_9HEMI
MGDIFVCFLCVTFLYTFLFSKHNFFFLSKMNLDSLDSFDSEKKKIPFIFLFTLIFIFINRNYCQYCIFRLTHFGIYIIHSKSHLNCFPMFLSRRTDCSVVP